MDEEEKIITPTEETTPEEPKRGKGRPKGSPNVNHPEQIPPKVPKKKKQKYKGPPPKKDDRNFQQYVVVRETMKRIKWGWSKEEIYEWLKVWHPTNVETMRLYYKAALAAIDSRLNGRAKDIAETNLSRLEAIFDEAVEEGDRKSALSCIDMMNKMAGLYEHQINLNTNKPLFEIKID